MPCTQPLPNPSMTAPLPPMAQRLDLMKRIEQYHRLTDGQRAEIMALFDIGATVDVTFPSPDEAPILNVTLTRQYKL